MVSIDSKKCETKKRQPFYHLLAENDEITYEAYVSEQNLLMDDSEEPIKHPLIEEGRDPTTPEVTVVPELTTLTASPAVKDSEKLIAAPSFVCVYVPAFMVAAAVELAGAERPPRVAETLLPETEYELPILVA